MTMEITELWETLTIKHHNVHARLVSAHSGIPGNDIADYGTQLTNMGVFSTNEIPFENDTGNKNHKTCWKHKIIN